MSKYSPKPWRIEDRKHVWAVLDAQGRHVALFRKEAILDDLTPKETLFNACLVSCAPELFEFAESLVSLDVDRIRDEGRLCEVLRSIIQDAITIGTTAWTKAIP
jgi:hypothetical protein